MFFKKDIASRPMASEYIDLEEQNKYLDNYYVQIPLHSYDISISKKVNL